MSFARLFSASCTAAVIGRTPAAFRTAAKGDLAAPSFVAPAMPRAVFAGPSCSTSMASSPLLRRSGTPLP